MAVAIDIVTFDSRGLRRSAEIMHAAMTPAFRTQIHVLKLGRVHLAWRGALKSLANRVLKSPRVMIFLEVVPAAWIGLTDRGILIPNQEWMSEETLQSLPRCAQIWCKTRYAADIFQQRGFDTRFIGFSSKDMYLPACRKDYGRFLHVSGKSAQKGTGAILDLWRRHPEWPPLLTISRDKAVRRFSGANVLIRGDEMPEAELQTLMNVCGVHLCPSEAEGFGHTISEGLSTKALVISTDAPPMNEMVQPGYGLLAKYHRRLPMGYGEGFLVDPADLERQVEAILRMSAHEKARMGEAARRAYLERDVSFAPRLLDAMRELVAVAGSTGFRRQPAL